MTQASICRHGKDWWTWLNACNCCCHPPFTVIDANPVLGSNWSKCPSLMFRKRKRKRRALSSLTHQNMNRLLIYLLPKNKNPASFDFPQTLLVLNRCLFHVNWLCLFCSICHRTPFFYLSSHSIFLCLNCNMLTENNNDLKTYYLSFDPILYVI